MSFWTWLRVFRPQQGISISFRFGGPPVVKCLRCAVDERYHKNLDHEFVKKGA